MNTSTLDFSISRPMRQRLLLQRERIVNLGRQQFRSQKEVDESLNGLNTCVENLEKMTDAQVNNLNGEVIAAGLALIDMFLVEE